MIPRVSAGAAARRLRAAVRGWPLRTPRDRYGPVFIVGSARSGTTLMRAILTVHPVLHIPPETVCFSAIRKFRRYRRLPWSDALRIVLTAFEYHRTFARFLDRPLTPLYQELVEVPPRDRSLALVLHRLYMFHVSLTKPEATRWGDKTPWNTFAIGPIDAVFPDARFVHMVRDGRDVVASLLAMGRYSDASDAARRWVASIRAARRFGARHPDRYLEVRYEDLVTENAREVARACAFLDLPLDERMLRHHEVHSVVGDVEDIAHMAGARRAVHAKSIGKWKTTLTADQARATERILRPLLTELGYGDGASA